MTTLETKSLEELSQLTGIPILFFRQALGQPLGVTCDAKTASDARKEFERAPIESAAETAALIKLEELSLKEVEEVQTPEDAQNIYHNLFSSSKARMASLNKWIELCADVETARGLFQSAPKGSVEALRALKKWKELFLKKVPSISTAVEAERAYHSALNDCEALTALYEKWSELTLKEVGEAQTEADAYKAYKFAPKGSEAALRAMTKCIDLCTSVDQVFNLYDATIGCEVEMMALRKMCELYFGSST